MVNAWSLAYDVINGTLDENFPPMTDNTITSLESDEYDPKPKSDKEDTDWKDPVITVGSGNTASATFVNFDLTDQIDTVTIDTSNFDTVDLSSVELPDGMSINYDMDPDLAYMEPGTVLSTEADDLFASMDGVDIVGLSTANEEVFTVPSPIDDLTGLNITTDKDDK